MSDAQFGIAIVGENKVEKGAKAAEKRLGKVPEQAAKAGKKFTTEAERSVGTMSKGILRAFTGVEQAGAKAFGGRSLTSGLTSQMGALGKAGSALGTGLGEATAGAGLFEGAIGAVGVAVAGTIGIVAAAGYAAFKLADGWAKGAASIGRTAGIIGVGTKALQEFGAAAERTGVDKDKATGALGGLSENLNDARYGRNSTALAVLSKLGVAMKTNADGTVDVGAMLPQIADAIARQNSSGRRTAARALGIPIDMLPVFSQGGKQLAGDMKDADAHAVVLGDDDIAAGKRIVRKGAMVGQLKDQAWNAAGRTVAETAEPGYDAVLKGGTAISDAVGGRSGPAKVERGGAAVERGGRAVERGGAVLERAASRMSGGAVGAVASPGMSRYLAAVARVESGNNPNARAKTSSAVGLYQFLNGTWLGLLKQHGASHGLGWAADAIEVGRHGASVRDPGMRARILALRTDPRVSTMIAADMTNDMTPALAKALGHAPRPGDLYMGNFMGTAGASKFFRAERANPGASAAGAFPAEASANRGIFFDHGRSRSLAEVHDMMDRKIEIALHVQGLPQGAKVTARSKHAVAISHAMP